MSTVKVAEPESWTGKISRDLAAKLVGVLDSRIKSRAEYYSKNPEKIPAKSKESIDSIISSAANIAGTISGGLNLIPGPVGLVAIVPELLKVLDLQIGMVYDLAVAHGKQEHINDELVMSILLAGSGLGATVLAVQVGSKVLVKRASLRVMQSMAEQLSIKITQKAIGSSISKFLPLVGPLAMAAWTRHSTRELGTKALAILSTDIELVKQDAIQPVESCITNSIEAARLYALITLAEMDGNIAPEEESFLLDQIATSNLDKNEKTEIQDALNARKRVPVDFSVLAVSPEESIRCIVDMVALAGKDGVFHPAEKIYIKKSGDALGLSSEDVDSLMEMVELSKCPTN
jgi:uncharacterized membrane protein YebE (DUF533 family)